MSYLSVNNLNVSRNPSRAVSPNPRMNRLEVPQHHQDGIEDEIQTVSQIVASKQVEEPTPLKPIKDDVPPKVFKRKAPLPIENGK